ncbi:hypothetical protein [Hamadaea tsunoensis]|uniref:hypothetical protein n=1 Tax=Hamadaea tsunoensis TaxID=53368 RepID=UPI0003F8312F|nr:hypothetical protein [Hamadaea tsunoensis]
MTLDEADRRRIIDALDGLDDLHRRLILATFPAFVEWLTRTLPDVYARIAEIAARVWGYLRELFL